MMAEQGEMIIPSSVFTGFQISTRWQVKQSIQTALEPPPTDELCNLFVSDILPTNLYTTCPYEVATLVNKLKNLFHKLFV